MFVNQTWRQKSSLLLALTLLFTAGFAMKSTLDMAEMSVFIDRQQKTHHNQRLNDPQYLISLQQCGSNHTITTSGTDLIRPEMVF